MPLNNDHLVIFGQSKADNDSYHADEHKRVKGNPLQTTDNYFSDGSNQFHTGIWQAEPGCWKVSYSEFEYFDILEGVSILRDSNGQEQRLEAGSRCVVPAGFEGEWEVLEHTKKVYVIFEPSGD
ncbi:MAG: putative cupin superfamily protein [Oceanicoccus sp.]|jgi:uncharacterized cupin superfamily protein